MKKAGTGSRGTFQRSPLFNCSTSLSFYGAAQSIGSVTDQPVSKGTLAKSQGIGSIDDAWIHCFSTGSYDPLLRFMLPSSPISRSRVSTSGWDVHELPGQRQQVGCGSLFAVLSASFCRGSPSSTRISSDSHRIGSDVPSDLLVGSERPSGEWSRDAVDGRNPWKSMSHHLSKTLVSDSFSLYIATNSWVSFPWFHFVVTDFASTHCTVIALVLQLCLFWEWTTWFAWRVPLDQGATRGVLWKQAVC